MRLPEPRYQQFDGVFYRELVKELLKEKGSRLQREFLVALQDNQHYAEWIKKHIKVDRRRDFLPLLEERLTRSQFINHSLEIKHKIFDNWSELYPAEACRYTLWGYLTFGNIEMNKIQAEYLVKRTDDNDAATSIDKALVDNDTKKIDKIVRVAIGRASGLIELGPRSVYYDCAFAGAWWQIYIAKEVSKQTNGEADLNSIIKVLTINKSYWCKLIEIVVNQNSRIGDSKVRAALVWALSERLEHKAENETLFTVNGIKRISKLIGIRCAWQELGIFEVSEIKHMIEEEIFPCVRAS